MNHCHEKGGGGGIEKSHLIRETENRVLFRKGGLEGNAKEGETRVKVNNKMSELVWGAGKGELLKHGKGR